MAREVVASPADAAADNREASSLVPEFLRLIPIADAGRRVLHTTFAATEAERGAIARYLDLVALDTLDGTASVRPWRKGLALSGQLRARVTQTCVVTLDPVVAEIAQDFERFYLPAAVLVREQQAENAEIEIDAAEGEVPEPLPARAIPLGDILVEELSLALDPFPRAPGTPSLPPADQGDTALHPFAALARLLPED